MALVPRARARRDSGLKFFNRAYRENWLDRAAIGQCAMSYTASKAIAGGGGVGLEANVTCHRRAWVGAVRPVVVVPLALEWRALAFAGAKTPGLRPPTV